MKKSKDLNLITINGLKRVAKRFYEDSQKIKVNSMVKIDDILKAIEGAMLNEQGKF